MPGLKQYLLGCTNGAQHSVVLLQRAFSLRQCCQASEKMKRDEKRSLFTERFTVVLHLNSSSAELPH